MKSLCDEPTLRDYLARDRLTRQVGDDLINGLAPRVLGIHGEWGSGKTSFMAGLCAYLCGSCHLGMSEDLAPQGDDLFVPIWFEAWRYQHEAMPIVALLHEIRRGLSRFQEMRNRAKKLLSVAARSALISMESVTGAIGVKASVIDQSGREWEQRHHAVTLATDEIRELLEHTIGQLVGKPGKKGSRRLLVFIDDLDRCEPRAAFRLLEGLKIYLNLSNCIFVLGMDQRLIERHIGHELSANYPVEPEKREIARLAREYLDKICPDVVHLPLFNQRAEVLFRYLTEMEMPEGDGANIRVLCKTYGVLPANPRRIKAFANVLGRFYNLADRQEDVARFEPVDADGNVQADVRLAMAEMLLLAGYYYFHPRIFRQLEQDRDSFYNKVLKPFAEGDQELEHEALTALRPRMVDVDHFPHPSAGDEPRLALLTRALEQIRPDAYKAYMSR